MSSANQFAGLTRGFIVLDKPSGLTSHDCVAAVRRRLQIRRVGHGGTLDPAATGVLPVALGAATRLLPYLIDDKCYEGTVQLGITTSTDDDEGEVLLRQRVPPFSRAELEAALAPFRGEILQAPPAVSAVKLAGERAYKRVRRGEQVTPSPRPVTIRGLELLHWDGAARLQLRVRCGAGTYIRSLARDLGRSLGCGAALLKLRRTEALGFALEAAEPFSCLQADSVCWPRLHDPLEALAHLPRRILDNDEVQAWRCGRPLALKPGAATEEGPGGEGQPVVVVMADGRLAGMARISAKAMLQPKLVIDAAS
ncbi:MAG: tRNA pseudouridine(55) synthase TruB [Aphanocapsa feldmannii 288cV]|nr:MAG: tRNA pseudouridine(55) synthase TruB [Aphanocapsa feldmannii 288cV]